MKRFILLLLLCLGVWTDMAVKAQSFSEPKVPTNPEWSYFYESMIIRSTDNSELVIYYPISVLLTDKRCCAVPFEDNTEIFDLEFEEDDLCITLHCVYQEEVDSGFPANAEGCKIRIPRDKIDMVYFYRNEEFIELNKPLYEILINYSKTVGIQSPITKPTLIFTNESLKICGGGICTPVKLYGMDGKPVDTLYTQSDGSLTIPLHNGKYQGNYLLRIGEKAYKIVFP